MSEAELMELTFEATDTVLQVVALYFSIVSAYIAALYYFIHRAPVLLRLLAFGFVSAALLFLGIVSVGIERATSGVITALNALPERQALPPPTEVYFGLDTLLLDTVEIGVLAGWGMAAAIYLGLAYLTFLYRWERR